MSVHDAEPGDVYADKQGKLWRVMGVCHEPTVTVEEVEGRLSPSPYDGLGGVQIGHIVGGGTVSPSIVKARMSGGTAGQMWEGFKRIWRKDPV